MSAKAFVDLLAERQIVPAGTIEQLRKQISAAAKPIPAAAVAKALLDKQLLTAHQAQSLLDAVKGPATAAPAAKPAAPAKPAPAPIASLADEFGLAPMEDKPAAVEKPAADKNTAKQPAKPAPATNKPPAKPVREKPAAEIKPASSTDDPLFGGGSDDLFGSGALGGDLNGGGLDANDPLSGIDPLAGAAAAPTLESAAAKKKTSSAKPWKLWGAIAGSLLFLGAVAGIAATRDNGDGAWAKVQETIKQSPADAETALNGFLASYPLHTQAGQAQVLLAQIKLKELEKRSSNLRETAKSLTAVIQPLIAEPAITIVQPQLAKQVPETIRGLLVSAAGMDAKNTAGRAEIAELAKQLWLLGNDPRVIPYEARPWRSWDEHQETIAQLLRDSSRADYFKQLEPNLSGADPAALKAKLLESLTQYPELVETPEWQTAAKRAGL